MYNLNRIPQQSSTAAQKMNQQQIQSRVMKSSSLSCENRVIVTFVARPLLTSVAQNLLHVQTQCIHEHILPWGLKETFIPITYGVWMKRNTTK
jgi:hypothetical protein